MEPLQCDAGRYQEAPPDRRLRSAKGYFQSVYRPAGFSGSHVALLGGINSAAAATRLVGMAFWGLLFFIKNLRSKIGSIRPR